jgi:hypothetical protein
MMCVVMVLVKSQTGQNVVDLGTGRCSALMQNYIFQLKYSMPQIKKKNLITRCTELYFQVSSFPSFFE